MVHPVLVDFGAQAAAAERYLAVGATSKSGKFGLWATPIASDGTDDVPVAWTTATPVAEVLAGATAVCGIDATVNASGTLGILTVLRKAGQDLVVLITRDAKGVVKTEQLVGKTSKGDCRVGVAGARLAATGVGWLPVTYTAGSLAAPGAGTVEYLYKNSAIPIAIDGIDAATTDNATSGGPNHALAWRGLASPLSSGTSITLVVESTDGASKRSIHLWSWAP
jgi:hypothetical protein